MAQKPKAEEEEKKPFKTQCKILFKSTLQEGFVFLPKIISRKKVHLVIVQQDVWMLIFFESDKWASDISLDYMHKWQILVFQAVTHTYLSMHTMKGTPYAGKSWIMGAHPAESLPTSPCALDW